MQTAFSDPSTAQNEIKTCEDESATAVFLLLNDSACHSLKQWKELSAARVRAVQEALSTDSREAAGAGSASSAVMQDSLDPSAPSLAALPPSVPAEAAARAGGEPLEGTVAGGTSAASASPLPAAVWDVAARALTANQLAEV
jgi:hypothetical protein